MSTPARGKIRKRQELAADMSDILKEAEREKLVFFFFFFFSRSVFSFHRASLAVPLGPRVKTPKKASPKRQRPDVLGKKERNVVSVPGLEEVPFQYQKKNELSGKSPRKSSRAKITTAEMVVEKAKEAEKPRKSARSAIKAVASTPSLQAVVPAQQADEILLAELVEQVKKTCFAAGKDGEAIWYLFEERVQSELMTREHAQIIQLREYEKELDKMLAQPAAELLNKKTLRTAQTLLQSHLCSK